MYAVVETGGFQFPVSENATIRVPKIDAEPGSSYEIDKVLLIRGDGDPLVGRPYVEGARVDTEVVGHGRDDKVLVFKFKRRVKYRRLTGHRQDYTELKVNGITIPEVSG
jgi:large subunit ribosomal protein L21